MNKFGIKVYGDYLFIIDDIHYRVNSIKHESYGYNSTLKYRVINNKLFGIKLLIKNKNK